MFFFFLKLSILFKGCVNRTRQAPSGHCTLEQLSCWSEDENGNQPPFSSMLLSALSSATILHIFSWRIWNLQWEWPDSSEQPQKITVSRWISVWSHNLCLPGSCSIQLRNLLSFCILGFVLNSFLSRLKEPILKMAKGLIIGMFFVPSQVLCCPSDLTISWDCCLDVLLCFYRENTEWGKWGCSRWSLPPLLGTVYLHLWFLIRE